MSATGTSDPEYLSSITIDATADEGTLWEKNYDDNLYKSLTDSENDNYTYKTHYNTEDTALQISDAKQLAAFAKAVNDGVDFEGKYVKLMKDIDLNGKEENPKIAKTISGNNLSINITNPAGENGVKNVWTPIGTKSKPFKGTFDGGNKKVVNMTALVLDGTDTYVCAGLFGYAQGGSIKNTGVTGNVYISNSSYVYAGGLVGESFSNISNSYSTCNVYASSPPHCCCAGGLAGYSRDSDDDSVSVSISNSHATGNV